MCRRPRPTRKPETVNTPTADIAAVCRMRATLASTSWLCANALERAADEIERLRRWKDEAMIVLSDWDVVWDEAAGRPGPIGGSKATSVAREIERLRAELARFDPVLTLAEGDELTLGDGFVAYRGPGTLYDVDEETP